jgi:plastocyanin
MKRIALAAIMAIAAFSTAALAGTIHGKVSGVKGESVVYVEAVAGKTFPAPTQHVTMDQKGLMFVPHIIAIQQGTTVEFLNSDSVAHNVFWPSISGNKKLGHNLGTWPQGQRQSFKFDNPGVVRSSAMCIRTWLVTSSSLRRRISPRPTRPAHTRLKTCRTAPIP